jgi:hypothetical protein
VAKLVGDGWLSWDRSLGSNRDISQKYKMGDKGKEVANTLWPGQKNIEKTIYCKLDRSI